MTPGCCRPAGVARWGNSGLWSDRARDGERARGGRGGGQVGARGCGFCAQGQGCGRHSLERCWSQWLLPAGIIQGPLPFPSPGTGLALGPPGGPVVLLVLRGKVWLRPRGAFLQARAVCKNHCGLKWMIAGLENGPDVCGITAWAGDRAGPPPTSHGLSIPKRQF